MIVKITDGKDIRRFTANTNSMTYASIHKRAAEAFNLGSKDFKLKYKDDEGDMITMSTDDEISEAITVTLKFEPPVLRLSLEPSKDKSRSSTPDRDRPCEPNNDPPELKALFKSIKKQLPALLHGLPTSVKNNLENP